MTHFIADAVDRRLVRSPLTPEIRQMLVDDYGVTTPPQEQERIDELALVFFHGGTLILGILCCALLAALGAAARSHTTFAIALVILTAIVAWCCIGLGLHLARYYIATWRSHRSGRSTTIRRPSIWPSASSDRDFLVQTILAVVIAAAVGWS